MNVQSAQPSARVKPRESAIAFTHAFLMNLIGADVFRPLP